MILANGAHHMINWTVAVVWVLVTVGTMAAVPVYGQGPPRDIEALTVGPRVLRASNGDLRESLW